MPSKTVSMSDATYAHFVETVKELEGEGKSAAEAEEAIIRQGLGLPDEETESEAG